MADLIRVMLVDDHDVVRRGMAMFVRSLKNIEFVGEAADGEDAIRLAAELHPDVILMDMNMPYMNGIEATRVIHETNPAIRVIMLTSEQDTGLIEQAHKAGIVDYLPKTTTAPALYAAIEKAMKNGTDAAPDSAPIPS